MPTSTVTPHYNVFEKAPERRRRSVWSRLRRRPVRLAVVLACASCAAMVLTYEILRVTHSLPAQRRAERTLMVAEQTIAAPVFEAQVVKPLEKFLADGLPIARNTTPFADFIERSVGDELPVSSVLPPTRPTRLEVVQNWRRVIAALEREDVRVYGKPSALLRGDTWLHEFVASRLATLDPALSHIDPQSRAVDMGVAAIARNWGISPTELNGIAFVAERAQRLRTPASH